MNKHLALVPPVVLILGLLAGCSAPTNPEQEKMLADHTAMLKADSVAKANEAAVTDCFRKVFTMFETGNTEGIEGCVAENVIEHSPAPGITTTGLQALKDIIAMHHAAFPDTKMTILSSATVGDLTYVHYNMKATNTGAMGPDMPATNKTIDVNGVDIVRVENGKAAEHWGYWEEPKMMQQLGLAPGGKGN